MKIDFEGVTRVLDLQHVKLRAAVAIQEFTGLTLLDWQRSLISRDIQPSDKELTPAQAAEKMTALTDPGWILNMAAAHWLMLTQAAEEPPPLDDDYDCEVIDFALALYAGAVEQMKARQVQDKPDPTSPPKRPARSSRRTVPPKTVKGEVVPTPRLTGS